VQQKFQEGRNITDIGYRLAIGPLAYHHKMFLAQLTNQVVYVTSVAFAENGGGTHHAQLVSDDDGCVIEDLNSTNGVFLGEKQIKKHRLEDGDVVTLGVHELVYTDLRQHESANEEDFEEEFDEEFPEDVEDEDGDEGASVVGE